MAQERGAFGEKIMNSATVTNLLTALVIILLPAVSPAAGIRPEKSLINLWPVFTKAASKCRWCCISPATLAAVAFVESGLDYRLIRIESKTPLHELENSSCLRRTWHQDSKKCRVYVLSISSPQDFRQIESALSRASSFDAGLMQINSWWVKKLNLSLPDLLLYPENNAITGCMILAEALSRSRNLHDALEIYHHGHVADGRYARRVAEAMRYLVTALNQLQHGARKEG